MDFDIEKMSPSTGGSRWTGILAGVMLSGLTGNGTITIAFWKVCEEKPGQCAIFANILDGQLYKKISVPEFNDDTQFLV